MPENENTFLCLVKKYKALASIGVLVPLAIVLLIFMPRPKDIVYADLDQRYARAEQVQQQLQQSEQNLLSVINAARMQQLDSEIYQLERLEAAGQASPDDIARKNKLLRELNDLKGHD